MRAAARAAIATFLTSTAIACDGSSTTEPEATGVDGSVALSALDGSTTPTEFVLRVDVAGASAARLVVDGEYVGRDEESPLELRIAVAPGPHELRVRTDGATYRIEAAFTAAGYASTPTNDQPSAADGTVDSAERIAVAVASAQPGEVIEVPDGEHLFEDRLVASPSGTASAPITLRGSRSAILRTKNPSGDYGLHITGDYWRIEGLTVAHATKGIVLDGSVGTVIDGVEVFDIGDEGIHFRSCSSDGVLRDSYVHHTGRNSPQYGEGVYVGSANSNWSKYECTDAVEGESEGDNTERVLIEGNTFEDITAEGADLKEGTDSGTLRNNTFRRVGGSGKNSADSAVDAKGNGWLIEANIVLEPMAPWDDEGTPRPSEFADGFQAHSVYQGYGTGNTFRANDVVGSLPGFGIGLYPADGNVVTCDNEAPDASSGLVGDNSRPARCG